MQSNNSQIKVMMIHHIKQKVYTALSADVIMKK